MEKNQIANPVNAGNDEPNSQPADKSNPIVPPTSEVKAGEEPQTLENKEPKEQDHDWKKRYDNTARDFKKTSDEYQRTIETNQKLVEKNPQTLDAIAEFNPDLADRIATNLYGKSYEQHKEVKRIESMKETDPEKASLEETKLSLAMREQKLSDQIKTGFFEGKGIIYNKFDPNYQKVAEQLNVLNPEFVQNNLSVALGIAYNLAFPNGAPKGGDPEKAKKDAILINNANRSGGGAGAVGDGGIVPPQSKKQLTPAQSEFLNKFKNLTSK
jgi:hypothetical protein